MNSLLESTAMAIHGTRSRVSWDRTTRAEQNVAEAEARAAIAVVGAALRQAVDDERRAGESHSHSETRNLALARALASIDVMLAQAAGSGQKQPAAGPP